MARGASCAASPPPVILIDQPCRLHTPSRGRRRRRQLAQNWFAGRCAARPDELLGSTVNRCDQKQRPPGRPQLAAWDQGRA
eukprot:CAMPEP_0185176782 /NCGR_PEP_ID=MMETSP1139-20130426/28807_1 /TAXON_ID=298111 /ORGANISM="Pavlova sp., Strain CCMP459" /LENGTH=80 /DNA_ID=CAMNT_0027742557 /DNA_START=428 /DNA_END=670 /DNA_ORIENTATION=+